jgi:hypothetical protein
MVRLTIDRTCRLALSILVLTISLLMAFDEARAELITFDEYLEGTPITNQYQNRGVVFSGEQQPPIIAYPSYWQTDDLTLRGASRVYPKWGSESITVTFVDPTDGSPVEAIDVGFYYYILGRASSKSFLVTYYDINGGIISQTDLWKDGNPHIPPKLHKIFFDTQSGGPFYFWLDNLSFQTAGPLETQWIYPDSVNMGENYNIILRVHNPADESQTLSFSLEENMSSVDPPGWPLNEERIWQLDGQPYSGQQEEREIGPHQTEDFVFTLNHYWQWIAPWNAKRLFDIAKSLLWSITGLELLPLTITLAETMLASVTHVREIAYNYEGIANSQPSSGNIVITVPVSKKLAWAGSVFTAISAGKFTGAGLATIASRVGIPLGIGFLIAEAVLIVSAEVEYAVAADPVVDYTQLALAEPVPMPAVCIPDEEPASEVADLCSRLLGTLIAMQESYVRYDAAEDDGSLEWMATQHGLAQMYAEEAAQIKAELAMLAGSFLSFPIPVPDDSEIYDIRQMIVDSGLPEIEECILAELGYTPEEIEGIVEAAIEFPDDFFINFPHLPETLGISSELHRTWSENLPPLPEGLTSFIFDVDPDTLKAKNKGGWITVYIELPEGHNVGDINLSNVTLADNITPRWRAHRAGDHDRDGVSDLKVKFKRQEVINVLVLGNNIIPVTVTLEGDVVITGVVIIRLIPSVRKK